MWALHVFLCLAALSGISTDVEGNLKEIGDLLEENERRDKEMKVISLLLLLFYDSAGFTKIFSDYIANMFSQLI